MDNPTDRPLVAAVQERDKQRALLAAARAAREDPGMRSLRQLLLLRLEECKATLLQCQPDEFLAAQARARVYQSILREVFHDQ